MTIDQEQLTYFVAKYQQLDDEDLAEVSGRVGSLSEEAAAALNQVRVARGQSMLNAPSPETQEADVKPKPTQESNLSAARLEIVGIRKRWLLWSFVMALAAGWLFALLPAHLVRESVLGILAPLALMSAIWFLVCSYKLSRAIDPSRSVAWTVVALQVVPVLGWVMLFSLVLKAHRLSGRTGA